MSTETVVRERGIPMSAPMVRAILDGSKTQTRRVVKGAALEWLAPGMFTPEYVALPENGMCPYGAPGERLWVRECAWYPPERDASMGVQFCAEASDADRFEAARTLRPLGWRHRPSILMPRGLSRLTLEITDVRVQRVQAIDEVDALAEGVEGAVETSVLDGVPGEYVTGTARDEFRALWDSLNANREGGAFSWDRNPWVWAISFRRITS